MVSKLRMKMKSILVKVMTMAVMMAAAAGFAGCGNTDDSGKAYLDEINVKDYVKLGEYKGLEITQAQPEITDEYRDSYINYMLSLNPEEGVKEGDTVNIDYVGTEDGVAFEGGTASGTNLTIGSGQFIPGFEEGLIGAKAGDTLELALTFPEDYRSPEMAGKAVVFTVTVNTIMAATPRELTDEYVQSLGMEMKTADEFKQYIYDMLYEQEMAAYEANVENAVVTSAMEKSEFKKEPPQAMIDRYTDTLTSNLTSEAANYGRTLEEFMQLYYGMDAQTYPEEIRSQAVKSAQQYIMLKAIADEENLNVSEEELQAEMEEMAEASGAESVDSFKEKVNDKGYKEYMMGQKVMDMLRENAVISAE